MTNNIYDVKGCYIRYTPFLIHTNFTFYLLYSTYCVQFYIDFNRNLDGPLFISIIAGIIEVAIHLQV